MKSPNVLRNEKGWREKGGWTLSSRLDPDHRLPLHSQLISFNVSKEQNTQLQPCGPDLLYSAAIQLPLDSRNSKLSFVNSFFFFLS